MEIENDPRPKITIFELLQIVRDLYYLQKKTRHDSKFVNIKLILIAFTLINKPAYPSEIANSVREQKKKFPRDKEKASVDIKSQVKYYLKELTKIGVVEKNLDTGQYHLAYKIIPPPLEKNLEYYTKHDTTDLSVVVPLLETIRDCCEQLIEYFQKEVA